MDTIGLQQKAKPLEGTISCRWFENEQIGLARTLFHSVEIPFEPFDSGLDYVSQPEKTSLVVDWADLKLDDPSDLDEINLAMDKHEGVEASIYLGSAHNWAQLDRFLLKREGDRYRIECSALVEFENEGVAENERFEFSTFARFIGGA
jgi:hypothetical protein